MTFIGGYNVMLEGAPSNDTAHYDTPEVLHLPLFSRRLDFSLLQVEHGQSVTQGQVLATDPENYSVPLLAPLGGTVNLEAFERHVTLENLSASAVASGDDQNNQHSPEDQRKALIQYGVWQALAELSDGSIPDPETDTEALIITLTRLEPFFPNPDVFLINAFDQFTAGLHKLHSLCADAPVQLICSEANAALASRLRQLTTETGEWLGLTEVPDIYPYDSPTLTARSLGLKPHQAWTIDPQGVLAVEAALGKNQPWLERMLSVGGPAAEAPGHVQAPLGLPLATLLGADRPRPATRLISGGILTGAVIGAVQMGLDLETTALTLLEENIQREVLAFAQAGFTRQSFSGTFASALKPLFREKMTTALRGESRPCVFCGYCEDVCPAGIIPHLIYRYLDHDRPEDAERVGFDKCIACGLCAYVCLSKIDHLDLFLAEKVKIQTESVKG
jgi:Na+-transporting NADH:ubiquinone oxidoreductase subunit A